MPKIKVKCANPNCKGVGFKEVYPYRLKETKNFFCCPEHAKLGLKTNRYEFFDDYAELIITSKTYGEVRVKIDKEDVDRCKELTWIVSHNKRLNSWYIQNNTWTDGVCKTTALHRFIMNCPQGMEVDHQQHDFTDCRKQSLKIVTRRENLENLRLSPKNKSGYRGVCFRKDMNKWQAYYSKDNQKVHVGFFDTAELANEAVVKARNEVMTNNVLDRLDEDNQGA